VIVGVHFAVASELASGLRRKPEPPTGVLQCERVFRRKQ
jgi:hypothetical protein